MNSQNDETKIDTVKNAISKIASFKMKNKTSKTFSIQGRSLFIFGPENKLRLLLKGLLEHPYFESFIFHLIGMNSLLLVLD